MWSWDQALCLTFHWYLWRHLLLVLSAPLLPVSPLLLGQSRRHVDQTGDRLSGAKSRPDYQRISWQRLLGFSFLNTQGGPRSYLFCGLLTRWYLSNGKQTFRNVRCWRFISELGQQRVKMSCFGVIADLLTSASSVCIGRLPSPWTSTYREDPLNRWAPHTGKHLEHKNTQNQY